MSKKQIEEMPILFELPMLVLEQYPDFEDIPPPDEDSDDEDFKFDLKKTKALPKKKLTEKEQRHQKIRGYSILFKIKNFFILLDQRN